MTKIHPTQADDFLSYWFGELADGWSIDDRQRLWFGSTIQDDVAIKERFGEVTRQALAGQLLAWLDTPEHTTAYIILLDQITRVLFRGTADAFIGDKAALSVCKSGIDAQIDLGLPPAYRMFFYMPLEHSERLEDQNLCVEYFDSMRRQFSNLSEVLEAAYTAVSEHRDIILKFGRFPHRNLALGRESTVEENEFLQQHKGFGQ